MITRLGLGAIGVLTGVYGAYLLLQQGWANLLGTAIWLAGGIVAHDFIWAPIVVVVASIGARLVLPTVRPLVTAALVVIVTVTISAVPALGRFGARPDNPTLLPRNYLVGWLVFVALVVVGTLVVGKVLSFLGGPDRRESGGDPEGS